MNHGDTFFCLFFIFALVLTVGLCIGGVYVYLNLDRNVNGYWDRAEDSTRAGQMANFLQLGLNGLDDLGISSGNWALINETPNTQMDYAVQQIENIIWRCRELEDNWKNENLPVTHLNYSYTLEGFKDDFREVNISVYELYTKENCMCFYPTITTLLLGVVWILFVFGLLFYAA